MRPKPNKISFNSKNKEINHAIDRLSKYPIIKIDPKLAQILSRHKKIRYLSYKDVFWIRKGIVGYPPKLKIRKNDNGTYLFEF